MTNTNQNSKCCNAPVERGGNLNGTSYYVCDKCAQPCDVRANQNWEKEFDRALKAGELASIWQTKNFIQQVEQQAKEQGRREGIEECVDELSSKLEIERQKGPQGIVRDTMNARTSQIIRLLQSKLTQH